MTREWAMTASVGDYLAEYEDDGMTPEQDPGNRCGYDDAELAQIQAWLAQRGLRLTTDDRGLVVAEAKS